MTAMFLHVCVREHVGDIFLILELRIFRLIALGTVVYNMFLSFMAILFPHESARDPDKECFLALHGSNLGFFLTYDERGKCVFPSWAKSTLLISRR